MRFPNRAILYFLLLTIIQFSCNKKDITTKERPIDAWVFRTVLDGNPRMITMALDKSLWVSFHTETGSLYKAWKGSVYFDGAVYTTAHGPQPITIGNSYMEGKKTTPWVVLNQKGDTIPSKYDYKGHRFVKGRVQMMHQLSPEGATRPIRYYEEIESDISQTGQPILKRKFITEGIQEEYVIGFHYTANSIISADNIFTNGTNIVNQTTEVIYDDRKTMQIEGLLKLNNGKDTDFDITFIRIPIIENTNNASSEEEEDKNQTGTIPEGLSLIAKSDCKTCHNKTLQTIGPAYISIAEKYKNSQENISILTTKVKNGGAGVWGEQAMTPHPDLPEEDIKEMVSYIMSLDDDSKTVEEGQVSENKYAFSQSKQLEEDQLLPGSIVKVYNLPQDVNSFRSINDKAKPIFAGVMPHFANMSGNDFKELQNAFGIDATGYIKVDTPGTYIFQLWSDDGSGLFIHDKEVITNDGPHGAEFKEATIDLTKGYHPYKLKYYQGFGGSYLSLLWKKPRDVAFETIPSSNFVHEKNNRKTIEGLTLPMSDVSKVPGDKYPLEDVHPSFDLYQARPDHFKPKVGGMDFMSNGNLIVSTWDAEGSVYLIENSESQDSAQIKVKRIAFGLAEPLGVKVVDDTIYVMQKQEITKLVDIDGDGVIDEYRTLCNDWKVSANFHEFGFGLVYKDGYFYGTLATAINPGGASTQPQIPDRGKVVKVNKVTGEMTLIASGLRTPNGIGIGYNGEIFVADNQGDWLPSSKIVHVKEGAWFGSRSVDPIGTANLQENLPVVWLPQDEIGNSPSTPLALNYGLYKGQMIHGEVTHGGIKRVFVEEIDGQLQGCVFRFIQGLEAGVNRIAYSPKGDLYVGGIGNPGNWGQSAKLHYGLQRLVFNDKPTFEMLAIRAKTNGIEIEFTEPLRESDGWNPLDYEVRQWYYKPTIDYGGPKLGEKQLKVKSATVSEDKKKVFLEYEGNKPNHMIYVRLKNRFISENNHQLWSTEAWYTMNKVPKNNIGAVGKAGFLINDNTLTPNEIKDGWKLLFDGKKIDQWHTFKHKEVSSNWQIDGGLLRHQKVVNPKSKSLNSGDLITNDSYKNFDFTYEWKIDNCGNSGVMFNVIESAEFDYTWQTGPEMQILDNTCHPDAKYKTHKAGDLYDMIECRYTVVKPAGEWNRARIWSKDGNLEFWLNGVKVVSFTMGTEEWEQMIAKSKFKDMPNFGKSMEGHISLQDHSDTVWFKNLKIKVL